MVLNHSRSLDPVLTLAEATLAGLEQSLARAEKLLDKGALTQTGAGAIASELSYALTLLDSARAEHFVAKDHIEKIKRAKQKVPPGLSNRYTKIDQRLFQLQLRMKQFTEYKEPDTD